jgi:2-phospho-L-lactate guanylyltransferase
MGTFAILPAKSFQQAKQRLRQEVPAAVREALAEAMLRDVLAALTRCASLAGIIVVTPSEQARRLARESGARALADDGQGHNAAARMGIEAALAAGATRVLLVPGDCPALDPAELDELVACRCLSPSVIIIPDRHGTGTNGLLLTPPRALAPSFGPGSCARHAELARNAGVHSEVVVVASLALDIDTPEDLESLAARAGATDLTERAPHTSELLSRC